MEGDIIDADFNVDFESDNNQLQIIVKESGLEESTAKYILNKFQDYFTMADEWAKQTPHIVVTNANQTDMMKLARTGRLALREKRLAIEKSRKELKEQSLREGKAIDGIANVLKALIIPIEEYLEKQERFVEFQEAAKAEAIRLEIEKKMEEERIAKEKAESEALARAQADNARLRKEAEAKERALEEERRKVAYEQEKLKKEHEAKIAKERAEQQAKLDLVRKEQEAKLAKERAEQEKKLAAERAAREKIEAELRAKRQAEMKAEADKLKELERLKNAADSEKLQKFYNDLMAIDFPVVISQEAKRVIFDSKSHIGIAVLQTKKYLQSIQSTEEEF